MARLLLVRHAAGDHIGRTLAGRSPGVHLNAEGRAQAARLAARLATRGVHAVYSSPRERARETAQPIAERLSLPVHDAPGLEEVDYGDWTGRRYDEIDDPRWQQWNAHRSGTRIPGGELMVEIQARAAAELLAIAGRHPEQTVVAVSHADTIRAALTYFLGMPLDHVLRLEISPASVSEVELAPWGVRVMRVNDEGAMRDDGRTA